MKTQQSANTKSVARLVDSENVKKQQHAHTKSVARLVDSENLSKKIIYIKKKTLRPHKEC